MSVRNYFVSLWIEAFETDYFSDKQMNSKATSKCNHVWIDGSVDFGLSYTNFRGKDEILAFRENCSDFLEGIGFSDCQHCSICYLEKYDRDGKTHYHTYWQKELRLNREMVSAYYRQLRESTAPMHYRDFIPFWQEKSRLLDEDFKYRNKLPKE